MNQPTEQELNKMLDKVKLSVFMGSNAAFLGSIMCSLDFLWDPDDTATAWTDGLKLGWSQKDFLRCSSGERKSTMVHELWHVALMHQIRQGNRDPKIWNAACDYRINNNIIADGYEVPNNGWWVFDPSIDSNGIMAEEDIYELLMKKALPMPTRPMDDLRGGDLSKAQADQLVKAVVRAKQAAEIAGQAGKLPGSLTETLNTFLQPVIPWRVVLHQWTTDLLDENYTWKRRNRRFQDIYMPSREMDEGRLEHLAFIQDRSGSISNADSVRFNSEVKYVKDVLQPKKLTLVQFDTRIQYVREFSEDEPFEEVEMHGGGGTSLVCVREWIEKNEPTAAIIFSDLECRPMQPLTKPIPVIWAAIRNKHAQVPFGTLIHIAD